MLPIYLCCLIQQKIVEKYFLRSQNCYTLSVPFVQSELGKKVFMYDAPTDWNLLQSKLKLQNLLSLDHFKTVIRQMEDGLKSSAGSGSLVSDSVVTALGTSVSSESVPQPAQLSSQTLVQNSNESVVSSTQQLMQTSSQSSGQQPFVKPQKGRLVQVGSKIFSGTRPVQTSSSSFVLQPLQWWNESSLPGYQLVQGSHGSHYESRVQSSSVQPAQTSYQPVAQPSAQQSYQASSQRSEQAISQSVDQSSGQTSYQSVPQLSGLQSAQASYQSVPQPSGLQSAQTSFQSVPQPSGLQSAQTSYQSAQASYQSVPQPSGQYVSLWPGFQLFSMPERSSYESLSSFGSQPLEQPSNVQLASSYDSVLQPDLQDTAPLSSQTTRNKHFSSGMLRLLQQVKSSLHSWLICSFSVLLWVFWNHKYHVLNKLVVFGVCWVLFCIKSAKNLNVVYCYRNI